MTGGFHVEPGQLRSHASSIDAVSSTVEEAHTAAGTENIGGLIYGVLFDPLILVAMGTWQLHLQELMGTAATAGTSIADGVRSNADTYEGIEQSITHHVRQSGQPR